jgi:CHAT domain-containing protein
MSRAVAVQRASLAILDDTSIPAAHPALWAPFTLIGEAGR